MEKLQVNIVIEILGRPEQYVKDSLQSIATRIGAEKGIKILNKELYDPKPIEESKDFFTAFMELELELDSLEKYFNLIFTYMPSHIELVSPTNIDFTNARLNELANSITQRLHYYDALAKQAIAEKDVIVREFQAMKGQAIIPKVTAITPNESVNNSNNKELPEKESSKKKSKK